MSHRFEKCLVPSQKVQKGLYTDYYFFFFQRLSAEVKRLEAQLAMEREEKEMLSAELETLFQRLERSAASTDEGTSLARCMRDIIALKKKVPFWHDC